MENPNLHDWIMARAEGSDPKDDLRQIGFDPEGLREQIAGNALMGEVMLAEHARTKPVNEAIADYAMTWLAIGAGLTEEKHGRAAADSLPPLTDEPT